MPVHIAEKNGAGADHLQNRQPGSAVHILFGQLRLGGPDVVVKPGEQFHIVGIAAQQRHRRMGVRIVKGRNQRLAPARVDHPVRRFGDLRSDPFETVALDQHIGGFSVQNHIFQQQRTHKNSSISGSSGATAPCLRTASRIFSATAEPAPPAGRPPAAPESRHCRAPWSGRCI